MRRLIFYHMHVLWFCCSLVKGYCYQDWFEHKKTVVTTGLTAYFWASLPAEVPTHPLRTSTSWRWYLQVEEYTQIPWCWKTRVGHGGPKADSPTKPSTGTHPLTLSSLCHPALSHSGWRSLVDYSKFGSYAAGTIQGWEAENTAEHTWKHGYLD